MRRTTLVYLRRIIGLTPADVRHLQTQFTNIQFDDTKGYGFVNTGLKGSLLSTTLALRRVTHQTIFDPDSGAFSRQENVYFEQVPFVIDTRFRTLEIFSNADNARQVIVIIAELLNFRLAIPALDFSPPHVLSVVSKVRSGISLRKFVAQNFVVRPGVSGRYAPEVTDTPSALALIEAYPDEISHLTFVADLRVEDEVKLAVSRTGGLTLTCDEDNLAAALNELKNLLLGVEA
jgi:hypothetical protein